MLEYMNQGLQITGLGMGLVFLTLAICMVVIMLLDRIFRAPAAESARAEEAPSVVPAAKDADEAAAIAVALRLQQHKARSTAPTVVAREPGEEIVGGVMIVKPIVPAPWSGAARQDN